MDTIRESHFGQLIRFLSGNQYLLWPEEQQDFVCPEKYTRIASTNYDEQSRVDYANQGAEDRTILVTWYGKDDPSNPLNWSIWKKSLVVLPICLYTFFVYCGSAIYVPSELQIMQEFNVRETKAEMGLALYVLGYGLGPLLLAPLSEIASLGRNTIYIFTLSIFVIALCIPAALAKDYVSLMVLRFLQGFFGSPCLANGGASMQDMFSLSYLPFALALWVSAACCGPALGPIVSANQQSWRWPLWDILLMCGPVLLILLFCPETSADHILRRRARRLRKLTGNQAIQSPAEMSRDGLRATLASSLIKPIEIVSKDPALLCTNLYGSLIYGIYYSLFEVFPLVYPPIYRFSLNQTAATFLAIIIGCCLGIVVYCVYLYFYNIPNTRENVPTDHESRLLPALYAVFIPPIGLLIFGWTARESVHWSIGLFGIAIYAASVFIIVQCLFIYIPLSYPRYAASLFAANDFSRSAFAFAAVLFSRPMYIELGVRKGVSLLAGLSVIGVAGIFLLYIYGSRLRARSKFAG